MDIQDNIGGNTTEVLGKLATITDQKKKTNLTAGAMIVSIAALDIAVSIADKQSEIEESEVDVS